MSFVDLHYVCGAVLFASSMIGCFLPYQSKFDVTPVRPMSTGIIFGVAICHLLPDSSQILDTLVVTEWYMSATRLNSGSVGDDGLYDTLPVAEALMCLGIFIMLVIDQCIPCPHHQVQNMMTTTTTTTTTSGVTDDDASAAAAAAAAVEMKGGEQPRTTTETARLLPVHHASNGGTTTNGTTTGTEEDAAPPPAAVTTTTTTVADRQAAEAPERQGVRDRDRHRDPLDHHRLHDGGQPPDGFAGGFHGRDDLPPDVRGDRIGDDRPAGPVDDPSSRGAGHRLRLLPSHRDLDREDLLRPREAL
eukprot:CAMPEP_0197200052 /NCGR_PEP_ID=MMETSP1423-20130617/34199_1 /TAXON_ID=476441 /ORGANISM="Pseudo-nitzschia heimii, Strain UNC1101" /LENGTH=302 /DNA_ID=CAMNT_0042653925 /DNA_START=62 /DNA_END=969 /DNA_ORIENTATION=+